MQLASASEGRLAPLDFEIFSKKGCFLSFERQKSNFTTFGPPLEELRKNPLVVPYWKNPSDAQGHWQRDSGC